MGMASQQFMKRSPSLASAADDMTAFIILATVKTEPLLAGYYVLLDMKKCPPALLRAFGSERSEASLWPARTMSLAS